MTFPSKDPDTRAVLRGARSRCSSEAGIPVPVVSGGGTPRSRTWTASPCCTEHRAGTCVFNDAMVVSTGTAAPGTTAPCACAPPW